MDHSVDWIGLGQEKNGSPVTWSLTLSPLWRLLETEKVPEFDEIRVSVRVSSASQDCQPSWTQP